MPTVASYVWTETSGIWSAGVRLVGDGGRFFMAEGIACPDATTCLVVGDLAGRPAYATEIAGAWGAVTALRLPALSPVETAGSLTGISCSTAAVCEAVGVLDTAGGAASVAGAATWSHGAWSSIGYLTVRRSERSRRAVPSWCPVSCPSTTWCTAIGGEGIVPAPAATPAQYSFSSVLSPTRVVVGPGMPFDVGGRGIDGGALLGWRPPLDDGGATVTSFTATVAGRSCRTASDACAIRGLVNGRRYDVSVTDTTSFGTSSAGSGLVVAGGPPRPPSGLHVASGIGQLELSWRHSISPGETVHDYLVTLRGPGRSMRHCVTRRLRCRVAGLERRAAFVIDVVASNASGTSAPSERVRAVTR